MIHEIVSEGVERSKHFQEYVKEITKALKKYKATPVWDFGLPFDDSTWQKEFVTTRTVSLGMSLEEKKTWPQWSNLQHTNLPKIYIFLSISTNLSFDMLFQIDTLDNISL
jgi:hypothetical protein